MLDCYIPEIPEEETLCEYFPNFKENLHLVTSNKYFLIEKKKKSGKKQTPRQAPKGKISKTEWFENLEVRERVDAVSTIATDNPHLIQCIKNDILKIEDKYRKRDEPEGNMYSNEDYIISGTDTCQTTSMYSQNWEVSYVPEFPGCLHKLLANFTFLDYKSPEDTISVLEEFVFEPVEFFHTLKTTWDELKNNSIENYTTHEKHVHKLMTLG